MPTVCLHCALRAAVAGKPPSVATFDEAPEAHLARVHPDPEATARERTELEQTLRARGGHWTWDAGGGRVGGS